MSDVIDPERAALAQAKLDLINAAKAVDPLSLMRRQPLVCVGIATGVGAVLGMSEAQLFSPGQSGPEFLHARADRDFDAYDGPDEPAGQLLLPPSNSWGMTE